MSTLDTHKLGRKIVIKELEKIGVTVSSEYRNAIRGPVKIKGRNLFTLLIKASKGTHQPSRWNVGKKQKPNEYTFYVFVNVDFQTKRATKLLVVPSIYVYESVKNWENPQAYIDFSDYNEEIKFLNNWEPILHNIDDLR